MKKYSVILAALLAGALLLAGCSAAPTTADTPDTTPSDSAPSDTPNTASYDDTNDEKHQVELTIKDHGTIKLALNATAAPESTANFLKLAQDGFYDGLTFHRIISGFMMQGGDPLGNGTGGAEETIKGEFSANGVENPLLHTRGALSMARSQANDSASSQFFIVHQDSPTLDGQYAVFGYVTEGMEIVDAICEGTPVQDGNGTVAAEDQPVITSIKVIA